METKIQNPNFQCPAVAPAELWPAKQIKSKDPNETTRRRTVIPSEAEGSLSVCYNTSVKGFLRAPLRGLVGMTAMFSRRKVGIPTLRRETFDINYSTPKPLFSQENGLFRGSIDFLAKIWYYLALTSGSAAATIAPPNAVIGGKKGQKWPGRWPSSRLPSP